MSRVRVLFVIGTMSGGGSERRLIDLLQRLDRTRFIPELYLAYQTGELLGEVPSDVRLHAFTDVAQKTSWRQWLAGRLRLLSEARMWHLRNVLRREHYDLIFAWGLRRAYETALPALSFHVPRIAYCVADPVNELRLDFPIPSPWRYAVSRWSYRTADLVCANSVDLCRRLEQYYRLPSSSVALMTNLKDFSHLDQLAQAETPDWPSSGVRLLTVGRLQAQKNHAGLIDAMDELVHRRQRDVQLVICGQGPLESALRDQIQRLNLTDSITLAGFVKNPYPYYRTADIFVLPSLFEGSPNTLIEAMALGTPAIAADCQTGPREILADGRFGALTPPGDTAALVNVVEHMLDHLPQARDRAKLAQPVIRERHDLNTGIRRLEQQLLDLIPVSKQ